MRNGGDDVHQAPAFSFYAADFLVGVNTLTLAERGAYITLLAHQWAHGSVPGEAATRARILGGHARTAGAAWIGIRHKFEPQADGTWRNARLEVERAKQAARQQALAANGEKGAQARWAPRDSKSTAGTAYQLSRSGSNTQRILTLQNTETGVKLAPPDSQAIIRPMANGWQTDGLSSSSSEKKEQDEEKERTYIARTSTDFEEFWAAYPKKKAKGDALRAWRRLHPPAALCVMILAAIHEQMDSEDWRKEGGRFIPNPATWLNAARWTDEAAVGVVPLPAMGKQTTRLAAAMANIRAEALMRES